LLAVIIYLGLRLRGEKNESLGEWKSEGEGREGSKDRE